jgi:hypothetical protein
VLTQAVSGGESGGTVVDGKPVGPYLAFGMGTGSVAEGFTPVSIRRRTFDLWGDSGDASLSADGMRLDKGAGLSLIGRVDVAIQTKNQCDINKNLLVEVVKPKPKLWRNLRATVYIMFNRGSS